MDKKTLEFVTYCIGKLSVLLKLPQKEIYKRLKASGILYDYIVPSYDVLHTFSSRYLMEDLTEYMKEKGVLPTFNVPIDKATDIYYNSGTANLIDRRRAAAGRLIRGAAATGNSPISPAFLPCALTRRGTARRSIWTTSPL